LALRPCVERYLPAALDEGRSARGVLGRIRRKLVAIARAAHRDDLAALLVHPVGERQRHARAVAQAIDVLCATRPPEPQIADDIAQWFAPRAVRMLHTHGIITLAELTVRIPNGDPSMAACRRARWPTPCRFSGRCSAGSSNSATCSPTRSRC
jgi:Phage integrase protein